MSERMLRSGTVKVEASASPEQVWEVLTDVTRVGEWSHECQGAQWLTGEGATVGARFRGRNRAGVMRWSRACTITEVEPTKRLVYRTKGGVFGDATEWTFDLEATAGGCRVVQRYKVLSLPRAVEWMILKMVPRHSDRSAALRADIERLGQVATTEARSDQNRA